ncbi:MAG: phosphopentomutase [Lachnospiraceae bacterium]|nr:phosphopentomutase [Candidatus Equihabitans merdae]
MKNKYKRIFVIVIDSMGIGGAKDAADFNDEGADTLGHIASSVKTFLIPNLQKMGLANIKEMPELKAEAKPLGYQAVLNERSNGKDTMTGHWEMMGIHTTKPFITFTETGFPPELIAELEERCGKKVIGNKSASGTQILDELAEQEINDGKMIVYTSADSVLQICGNEETFDLKNLYRCCEIAREITMKDEWKVGRVIARPYVGKKVGEFKRTSNRHDYALSPSGPTTLNVLQENGYDVISVGKIADIFNQSGITEGNHSDSSVHGMEQTIDIAKRDDWKGVCFTNLVDFDALWGHRRNVQGYAQEIVRFDVKLGELLRLMKEDDLLMVTADHGNDPTYTGTDHTREQVPLLMWSPSMEGCGQLPDQDTFGVIGYTIADNFGLEMPEGTIGQSLLGLIK